jgi:hypothetical protein
MATYLKKKEARSLDIESPAFTFDNGGRRLGIERRQFEYSLYVPERRLGIDRRVSPERRDDPRPES